MLDRVAAIALNTYREALRARILLGLAGVAVAIAFYSLIVGTYTLRNAPRVVSDLGVGSVSVFGIAVAVIISATSLYRELEQKTLFPILARPVRRGEYLVGKYLGTLLPIAVFVMADAGLVLLLGAALGGRSVVEVACVGVLVGLALPLAMWRSAWARTYGPIPWAVLVLAAGVALAGVTPEERRVVLGGGALALLEIAIVAALGVFFSSFSTPFLSALLTVGVVLIGRSADLLAQLPVRYFGALGPLISPGGKILARLVPNLYVYVPPRPLLTGEAVGAPLGDYLAMAAVAAIGWVVGLLGVAAYIFRKRDFL
jgi:ABC-type transport system involved in multi-copper enzyme maturation permease subunit